MTANNPGMTKRGSRVEGGENGEAEATAATEAGKESPARHPGEAGGEGERSAALDEILRHLRQLTGRVEEAPERETEPKEEARVPAGVHESGNVAPTVPGAPVGAAGEVARALQTQRADFGKWAEMQRRGRRRWAGLAIAAGFPAALMLGVLVQLQFQAIPPHDPTGGWRGHVWENYGRRIVDCAVEAMATNAEVDCPLVVRRP